MKLNALFNILTLTSLAAISTSHAEVGEIEKGPDGKPLTYSSIEEASERCAGRLPKARELAEALHITVSDTQQDDFRKIETSDGTFFYAPTSDDNGLKLWTGSKFGDTENAAYFNAESGWFGKAPTGVDSFKAAVRCVK